jgi:hypothetical protein
VPTKTISKSDIHYDQPQAKRIRQGGNVDEEPSQRAGHAFVAKSVVSGAAFGLLIMQLLVPEVTVDGVTVGILAIAILPWASNMIESAQLPGGWGVTFRRLEARQAEIAEDVSTLRFLVGNLITEPQKLHLEQLAADGPFLPKINAGFLEELRHLRRLGFIDNFPGCGTRVLESQGGDVKDHFFLTARGRQYLELRQHYAAPPPAKTK